MSLSSYQLSTEKLKHLLLVAPTMTCKRQYAFTLLELMLVLALLVMASGVCVIAIPKAMNKEKFSQGVEKFIDKVMLAQELMLNYQADVQLNIQKDSEGKILCVFCAERGVPPSILLRLNNDPVLPGIQKVEWNNKEKALTILHFSASENLCPHGSLTLIGSHERTLFLAGRPGKVLTEQKAYENSFIQTPYPQEASSAA